VTGAQSFTLVSLRIYNAQLSLFAVCILRRVCILPSVSSWFPFRTTLTTANNVTNEYMKDHIFELYHSRRIVSVWKSRSYDGALKENLINLYIFWKLNSYRIQSYLWNFLERYRRSDIKRNTQTQCFAKTGSLPRVNYRSGAINIGNVFSHITLKKNVGDFLDVGWFFFYTLLNFDIWICGRFLLLKRP